MTTATTALGFALTSEGDADFDPVATIRSDDICKRVLIVEDNPITQLVELQQLRILGCTPQAASSGSEALAALGSEAFDLILMDCRLPHMNGYETVRAIRAYEKSLRRRPVPIVAVTADGDAEVVDKCFSSGMDGHVAKPVTLGVLRKVLAHFIK